jgi:putative glutamine amidotransferase
MAKNKQILLAPHFINQNGIPRAATRLVLTDFLLDRNMLPVMSFFDTKFRHKEEALDLAYKYLNYSDALILQGGNDICPSSYNQQNLTAKNVAQFRDVFELSLIQVALQKQIPILGICRGMQLINISFGGDLHQHLEDGRWTSHSVFNGGNDTDAVSLAKMHEVDLLENSNLQKWLSKTKIKVNSEHHQGINLLAKQLKVEALSDDGLVEAFSTDNGRVLGLQWHPELDLQDSDQVRILDNWLELV